MDFCSCFCSCSLFYSDFGSDFLDHSCYSSDSSSFCHRHHHHPSADYTSLLCAVVDCDSSSYPCSCSSKNFSASYLPPVRLVVAAHTHPTICLHPFSQAVDSCTYHLCLVPALDSDAAPRNPSAAVSSPADCD